MQSHMASLAAEVRLIAANAFGQYSPCVRLMCYRFGVPKRQCEVTITLDDGSRHTGTVEAESMYEAACIFYGILAGGIGRQQQRVEIDNTVEVRPVYRFALRKAQDWANRKME